MYSPRNDPRNKPVVDAISEPAQYVAILRGALRFVDYLFGNGPEHLHPCYERNNWIPAASKVRYGLLCIAIRSPEHSDDYTKFCEAISALGKRQLELEIKDIPDLTRLSTVKELIEAEIKRLR